MNRPLLVALVATVVAAVGAACASTQSAAVQTTRERQNVRYTALPAAIDPVTDRLTAVVVMENLRDLPSAVTLASRNCYMQIELFTSARRESPPAWSQRKLGIECVGKMEIVSLDTLGSRATLRSAVPVGRIRGDSLAAGSYFVGAYVRIGDGGGFMLSAGVVDLP